jgi:hypothetical protein
MPAVSLSASFPRRSIPIGFQHSGRHIALRLDGPLLHPIVDGVWDAELLACEAGYEAYCEREIDEVEWQGGRVFLYLGASGTSCRAASRPCRPSPAGHSSCSPESGPITAAPTVSHELREHALARRLAADPW